MAKIEINLKEYNALKDKIKELENKLGDASNEISKYKEKLESIEILVLDLEGESIANRLFNWKKVVKPFKELVK